jgi:hypothetical protein
MRDGPELRTSIGPSIRKLFFAANLQPTNVRYQQLAKGQFRENPTLGAAPPCPFRAHQPRISEQGPLAGFVNKSIAISGTSEAEVTFVRGIKAPECF